MKKIFTLIVFSFCLLNLKAGVVYVDSAAVAGNNDGTTWADAYTSVSNAVFLANSGDTVAIAKGTYIVGASRTSTVQLKSGVHIFGSFVSGDVVNETTITQRDFETNKTIISGDTDNNGIAWQDAYNVISYDGGGALTDVILDGFTITGGYADEDNLNVIENYGGGLSIITNDGNITMRNLHFYKNYANSGGACSFKSNNAASSDIVVNMFKCTFEDNVAFANLSSADGGAIHIRWSYDNMSEGTFNIDSCVFQGNEARQSNGISGYGGALYFRINTAATGNLNITNSFFCDNSAELYGSALYINSGQDHATNNYSGTANVDIKNTTIINSLLSEAIYNTACTTMTCNSTINAQNLILWNSNVDELVNNNEDAVASFSYSNIEGSGGSTSWNLTQATDNGNNLDVDPMFISSNCDYLLHVESPMINAGNLSDGNNIGYDQTLGFQPFEFSDIEDVELCYGSFWSNIDFTIKYEYLDQITLTVESSNQTFVDNSYLQLSGTGENRTLTIQNANGFGTTNITINAYNNGVISWYTNFDFTISENVVIDSLTAFNPFGEVYYCVDIHSNLESNIDSCWFDDYNDVTYGWNRICDLNLFEGDHKFFITNGSCIDSMEISLVSITPNQVLSIDPIDSDTACGNTSILYPLVVSNESLENISVTSTYSWSGAGDKSEYLLINGEPYVNITVSDDSYWHQGNIYFEDDRGDYTNIYYEIYVGSTGSIDTLYEGSSDPGCYYVILNGGSGLSNNEWSYDGGNTWGESVGYPECNFKKWKEYELQTRGNLGSLTCYSNIYKFQIVADGSVIIDVEELESATLNVFPNPTNGILNVTGFESETYIQIFNILGAEVYNNYTRSNLFLDVKEFSKGNYILKATSNNKTQNFEFIVE